MKNNNSTEQAEFICNIGQRIRSYFFGNISRRTTVCLKPGAMGQLSPGQLQLLEMVIANEQITITGLAKAMRVSPSSVSIMVDRMVTCGWLHREYNSLDRRKVMISASAEAKKNITGIQKAIRKEIIHLIGVVGPETTQK